MLVGFLLAQLIAPVLAAAPQELIQQRKEHLQRLYQDLHQNPELSGKEARTGKKLAAELRALGVRVSEGFGGAGFFGVLENGRGPVTWVRTELDALPVSENTGLPFTSHNSGVAHMCGHDFHMASLAGVAYVLANSRDSWSGTVVFIGQPAEETVSGAKAMLGDGLLKKAPKPDYVLALHSSARYKARTLNIAPGFALCNVDSVDVSFKGKGSHGSSPHLGVDPFVMVAEYILRLQTITGREKDPSKLGTISVGSIHGGTKGSIIPEEVKLQLTARSYDDATRQLLLRRIKEIATGIAATSGAPEEPKVELVDSTDAVFNDVQLSQRLSDLFDKRFGKGTAVRSEPIMGGEDFGEFGKAAGAPSVFFWVGINPETGAGGPNHSPQYDPRFDQNGAFAIEAMAAAVLDLNRR